MSGAASKQSAAKRSDATPRAVKARAVEVSPSVQAGKKPAASNCDTNCDSLVVVESVTISSAAALVMNGSETYTDPSAISSRDLKAAARDVPDVAILSTNPISADVVSLVLTPAPAPPIGNAVTEPPKTRKIWRRRAAAAPVAEAPAAPAGPRWIPTRSKKSAPSAAGTAISDAQARHQQVKQARQQAMSDISAHRARRQEARLQRAQRRHRTVQTPASEAQGAANLASKRQVESSRRVVVVPVAVADGQVSDQDRDAKRAAVRSKLRALKSEARSNQSKDTHTQDISAIDHKLQRAVKQRSEHVVKSRAEKISKAAAKRAAQEADIAHIQQAGNSGDGQKMREHAATAMMSGQSARDISSPKSKITAVKSGQQRGHAARKLALNAIDRVKDRENDLKTAKEDAQAKLRAQREARVLQRQKAYEARRQRAADRAAALEEVKVHTAHNKSARAKSAQHATSNHRAGSTKPHKPISTEQAQSIETIRAGVHSRLADLRLLRAQARAGRSGHISETLAADRAKLADRRADLKAEMAGKKAAFKAEVGAARSALQQRLADMAAARAERLAKRRAALQQDVSQFKAKVDKKVEASQSRWSDRLEKRKAVMQEKLAKMAADRAVQQANRAENTKARAKARADKSALARRVRASEKATNRARPAVEPVAKKTLAAVRKADIDALLEAPNAFNTLVPEKPAEPAPDFVSEVPAAPAAAVEAVDTATASESETEASTQAIDLTAISGLGPGMRDRLQLAGIADVVALASADLDDVKAELGAISRFANLDQWQASAREILGS